MNLDYVRLMQVAHFQEWPRLEADAGERLILPAEGCFFGPAEGKFDDYARAATEAGVDCEVLDVNEARNRFPMFRFPTAVGAVHDHTAGVIAAARTMTALARLAEAAGASLMWDTRVIDVDVPDVSCQCRQLLTIDHRAQRFDGVFVRQTHEHVRFGVCTGITQRQLDEKPVELSFR